MNFDINELRGSFFDMPTTFLVASSKGLSDKNPVQFSQFKNMVAANLGRTLKEGEMARVRSSFDDVDPNSGVEAYESASKSVSTLLSMYTFKVKEEEHLQIEGKSSVSCEAKYPSSSTSFITPGLD